jgi:hypothetical protein
LRNASFLFAFCMKRKITFLPQIGLEKNIGKT